VRGGSRSWDLSGRLVHLRGSRVRFGPALRRAQRRRPGRDVRAFDRRGDERHDRGADDDDHVRIYDSALSGEQIAALAAG